MKRPPLRYFRTKNFKAIRDSGRVEFGWLTAFIGNNGSGKSSLVEAMETFRDVVMDGVDSAFRRWRGFQHVWNKSRQHKMTETREHRPAASNPMGFGVRWGQPGKELAYAQIITQGPGGNSVFIAREHVEERDAETKRRSGWTRDSEGNFTLEVNRKPLRAGPIATSKFEDGISAIKMNTNGPLDRWQFLALSPDRIGHPVPEQSATQRVRLARDGSNIAQYLNEIRELDRSAFEGILDAVRFVLPYAVDVQPSMTSEIERTFYLKMKEHDFEVQGWLLSTGTLRVLALLAALRHPDPPSLLVIEEIENGLDPRTVHMIVEEIRAAIGARKTQIILTTHSPYLLDLLDLSHIVVVEREEGQPVFRRPDKEALAAWSKSFAPGQLYTMGRLTRDES
jgi:predicted ATPase